MEIGSESTSAATFGELPEIQSLEELDELLKNQQPEGNTGAAPKPKPTPGTATMAGGEDSEQGEEEEKEGEGEGEDGEPKAFDKPSILHYLKDEFEFEMNLPEDREITRAEEAEGVAAIIQRMTEGVNATLEEYKHITELLEDEEVKALIEAKKQNKGLKDLYQQYSDSPLSLDNDSLVMKDFQKRFSKATPQAIEGMVKSLKDSGQFEVFAKELRDQYSEEQSLQEQKAEEQRKAEQLKETEGFNNYVKEFSTFIGGITKLYDVPITDEMKREVIKFDTQLDEKKMSKLDKHLQSKEGRALASLAILYMENLMNNSASLKGNKKKTQFADQLFDDARQLQSSGGRDNSEKEVNWGVLNNF